MNINQQPNNTAFESYDRNTTKRSHSAFDDMGIAPSLVKAINRLKFEKPTPIQKEAIPVAIKGDDVIALAQTGSGKTLAFGIPMLQRLSKSKRGIGVVLVPTRELAIQVDESIQSISRSLNIRTAVLIGGASMVQQRNVLKKNPRIIIATPGRLMDHLERRTLDLSHVEVFVLDEADRMLDMGFVPDIKKIMETIPDDRQTMLFSATMPKPIEKIAKQLMGNPIRIEINRSGATPTEVTQEIFMLKNQDKSRLLATHVKECTGPVLVFTRTKRMASKLSSKVLDMGFAAAEIHSDRSLGQRRNALEGFKKGRYQVLIATDIAARGIDVKGIELVVNYDMPANTEDYIHRIGRTGRAGKKGHAISFATSAQKGAVRDLERFMKIKLPISKLPEMQTEREFLKDGAHLNLKEILSTGGRPSKRRSGSSSERPARRNNSRRNDDASYSEKRYAAKSDRVKKEYSRDDKPSRSFSKDGSSKRSEFKKREPRDFTQNRFGSKPTHNKSEFSTDENSSNRRYANERTSTRREFFKADSPKASKYRFEKKGTSESDTVDRTAKKQYAKKNPRKSDTFFSKKTDSKLKSFKPKGSDKKFTKSNDVNSSDGFVKESSNNSPFWAKFANQKPTKKKSVGQGSGRKKRTKK